MNKYEINNTKNKLKSKKIKQKLESVKNCKFQFCWILTNARYELWICGLINRLDWGDELTVTFAK